jgi:CubicO group peptidase (beta-lactamase class C family)
VASEHVDVPGARMARRTVLKGAAAGVAVGVAGWPSANAALASADEAAARAPADVAAARAPADAHTDGWAAFDAAVAKAFARMGTVGAAVAVVTADRVLYSRAFGVRDLRSRRRVTNSTHFLVASTTKSMSSLLVATFVDQGKLGWDQKVIDAWPGFRAPTDELTKTLRVRDLMGMDTGIGEPPALSGLHEGFPTAPQLLQSVATLPVINQPGKEFFYNNTVYAVAGYLPLLREGASGDGLTAGYDKLMRERVYRPTDMTQALLADDPRGLVTDYSRGHGPDLTGRPATLGYGPVGSYWPVGGTLATLEDMIAYVRLHLRGGISVGGRRVVSTANLTERYKPQIAIPVSPEFDPDAVSAAYGLGLIHARYRDGSSLLWHNGGIDGFTAFFGFIPEHDIGLVVLNSMNPEPTGTLFYSYVLNLLLSQRLGLNRGVPAKIDRAFQAAVGTLRKLGRQSRPVDPRAVSPFLGYYEGGYQLVLARRELQVLIGSRVLPMRATKDGGYVMSGGLLVGTGVKLDRDADGVPRMELVGLETVRRTVGLA